MTRMFCMDGVNSMTGNAPDLPEYARICREYDALAVHRRRPRVRGDRRAARPLGMPYGGRGNSIVRYFGESYDNIVLVGGFSKSYSSLLAFMALPTALKNHLKVAAAPYLYSGPSPTASLATVLAGFRVNETEGDDLRARTGGEDGAGARPDPRARPLHPQHVRAFPIIELPLGEADEIDTVGRFLFDRGIYVTLAAYPLVPRSQVGFRIQMTAANADEEIEQLNEVLGELAERFDMQRRPAARLTDMAAVPLTRRLRRRDFRLLWTGMSVSLLGDGIFLVAMAWQAYRSLESARFPRLHGDRASRSPRW